MNETHPSIDHIVDYLHGELSAAEDAAIHAHLAGCSSCEELRAEEVAITETLRAHARAGERELPVGLAARIRAAAEGPPPASLWERLRAGLRPALILPAAAAIAIVLYFGFATRRGTPLPTAIDPSFYVENHAVMAASGPFSQDGAPVVLTSSDETP
jgi:anti-sigma factor RsiW